MNTKKINLSIYGIGNFGYAFLKHLDRKNEESYNLTAYDYNPERLNFIRKNRSHPVLHPGVTLSNNIDFVDNTSDLIKHADILLLSVPSNATKEALENIKKHATKHVIIVNTAKALDYETGKRLSEIVQKELVNIPYDYALLAGGTIADDLFHHEPLGIDIACVNHSILPTLQQIFESDNLRVYPTADLTGVEYAASFKNVISILAGIVHGLGFSYGSETYTISRTAYEVAEFCTNNLNSAHETFSIGSQCWGNDMWMSCTGNTRNRQFGVLLGQGKSIEDAQRIMREQNKTVEGINTLKALGAIENIRSVKSIDSLYRLIVEDSITVNDVKDILLYNSATYGG